MTSAEPLSKLLILFLTCYGFLITIKVNPNVFTWRSGPYTSGPVCPLGSSISLPFACSLCFRYHKLVVPWTHVACSLRGLCAPWLSLSFAWPTPTFRSLGCHVFREVFPDHCPLFHFIFILLPHPIGRIKPNHFLSVFVKPNINPWRIRGFVLFTSISLKLEKKKPDTY